jgi:hypothetical protein
MQNQNETLPATEAKIDKVLELQSEENQQRRMVLYSGRLIDWNSAGESDIPDRTTSGETR